MASTFLGHGRPHEKNVAGDYYVEDGCCITCGVPIEIAPQFLTFFDAPDGGAHCYVQCQPSTAEGHALMAKAMKAADVGCIRYRGADAAIRQQLTKLDLNEQIDD